MARFPCARGPHINPADLIFLRRELVILLEAQVAGEDGEPYVRRRVVAEPLRRVDPSPIFAFPDEIGLVPLVPVEIGEAGAPYFLVVLARAFDAELVRRL